MCRANWGWTDSKGSSVSLILQALEYFGGKKEESTLFDIRSTRPMAYVINTQHSSVGDLILRRIIIAMVDEVCSEKFAVRIRHLVCSDFIPSSFASFRFNFKSSAMNSPPPIASPNTNENDDNEDDEGSHPKIVTSSFVIPSPISCHSGIHK